jgi:hypothetical protein
MKITDARKLDHQISEDLRIPAVKVTQSGQGPEDVVVTMVWFIEQRFIIR